MTPVSGSSPCRGFPVGAANRPTRPAGSPAVSSTRTTSCSPAATTSSKSASATPIGARRRTRSRSRGSRRPPLAVTAELATRIALPTQVGSIHRYRRASALGDDGHVQHGFGRGWPGDIDDRDQDDSRRIRRHRRRPDGSLPTHGRGAPLGRATAPARTEPARTVRPVRVISRINPVDTSFPNYRNNWLVIEFALRQRIKAHLGRLNSRSCT